MATNDLRTPVWLLIGMTRSQPGILELAGGAIAFTSDEGRAFEAKLADATVTYPWYYFGGGCKITVAGVTHRISFVRPNDADDVSDNLLARAAGGEVGGAIALLTAGRKLQDIGQGRRAGKAWKAALASKS